MGCTESKAKEPTHKAEHRTRRESQVQEKKVPAPFCLPFSSDDFYTGEKLLSTEGDIGDAVLDYQLCIVGRCVNVSDGDSIRIRHIPNGHLLYPLRLPRKPGEARTPAREPGDEEDPSKTWKGKLTENTIRIRLYGIDAPETAKFGHPGQPFAQEAKQFVTERLLHKVVYVKCLSKDQYGRLLARVLIPRPDGLGHALFRGISDAGKGEGVLRGKTGEENFQDLDRERFIVCLMLVMFCRPVKPPKQNRRESIQGAPSWWCDDVCEELLMEGLACLYRGRGADYCDQRHLLAHLESEAKEKKIGLWGAPEGELQLPGDYKKSNRAGLLPPQDESDACGERRGSHSKRRKSRSRSPSPAARRSEAECLMHAARDGEATSNHAEDGGDGERCAHSTKGGRRKGGGGRRASKSPGRRDNGEGGDHGRQGDRENPNRRRRNRKRNRKRRGSAEASDYQPSS
ncbi:putative nuclease [Neospora caninum Liverpool]|uniref:Nuclease, putative n=1 Tax=Neospora caninum (strain Liverpool) TaxID=572307 RepID=F0VLR9_NEOCL|nr:putative nuclease [Neospora caninum Liverpool]CBZ54197.1 putative nuclease [Neospora caninum Liverpool]CEL68897.1 TPA: nuclease, putative [Neospora caninum Liverpool]|eukprot:XP_003884228.1 putative nuclease [Neospora caninum Liverpool]